MIGFNKLNWIELNFRMIFTSNVIMLNESLLDMFKEKIILYFLSFLNFDACMCCMMMFRWTNNQPRIQKIWHVWRRYQDIYDWISPLNKRSGLPYILTQQSMGRNE